MDTQTALVTLGTKLREAEALAREEGAGRTSAALARFHAMAELFVVTAHPEADWDAVAGNSEGENQKIAPEI